jgi:hypothetical protein
LNQVFQFFTATLYNIKNTTFELKTGKVAEQIVKVVVGDQESKIPYNQNLTYGDIKKSLERIASFKAVLNCSPADLVRLGLMFPQGIPQAQV